MAAGRRQLKPLAYVGRRGGRAGVSLARLHRCRNGCAYSREEIIYVSFNGDIGHLFGERISLGGRRNAKLVKLSAHCPEMAGVRRRLGVEKQV